MKTHKRPFMVQEISEEEATRINNRKAIGDDARAEKS
jgi:hypothetical protein